MVILGSIRRIKLRSARNPEPVAVVSGQNGGRLQSTCHNDHAARAPFMKEIIQAVSKCDMASDEFSHKILKNWKEYLAKYITF